MKLGLAPLVIMTALLAGCSGSSTTSAPAGTPAGSSTSASAAATPSASASASSPAAPSSAPSASASSTASASASASSTGSAAAAIDVCARLSLAEVNRLAGSSYAAQSRSTNRCTYGAKDGSPTGQDVGLLTGIRATTVSLASLVASEKQSLSSSSSKSVTIDGADDAAVVSATDQGKRVVSVLAKRKGVIYIVITEGERSNATYTEAATKVMTSLIAT